MADAGGDDEDALCGADDDSATAEPPFSSMLMSSCPHDGGSKVVPLAKR